VDAEAHALAHLARFASRKPRSCAALCTGYWLWLYKYKCKYKLPISYLLLLLLLPLPLLAPLNSREELGEKGSKAVLG
jgi:hypothetical protein